MDSLLQHLPPELSGFVLTLGLSLLIGFEREGHEPKGLGGVRTFPMIGLGGFLLATAFPESALPFALGLVVLGILIAISHRASVEAGEHGITTEVAALLTFTIGAAAARGMFWISIAAGVLAVVLLQEKTRLEGWARRLPSGELQTLVRFLVLSAVVLPALPNRPFTEFHLNPFTLWLVVVAVSGISYTSYLLQQVWHGDHGLLATGILGGAYSSTATTVAIARSSRRQLHPRGRYVGAIVAATGVMYLRLLALVALFAVQLAGRLAVTFTALGVCGIVAGVVLSRTSRAGEQSAEADAEARSGTTANPLELSSAVVFAVLFVLVLVVTRITGDRFGDAGVLILACIMGAADVDPFILGITQQAGSDLALATAALAVTLAAAVNNLMKGVYATVFGSRGVGLPAAVILTGLGVVSLVLLALT
jgi:uncharacterized membrane protein (DUF4010 family)